MSAQLAPALRTEFAVPSFVFGGVLVLTTAFSGLVDGVHPHSIVDEVQVVRAENVLGADPDLLAACRTESRKGEGASRIRDIRCDEKSQLAAFH